MVETKEMPKINLHKNDYSALRTRMDNDFILGMMLNIVDKDTHTNRKFEFPITLNDSMTFMQRSHYLFSSHKMDFEITSGDATKQRDLEAFYNLCLYIADKQLERRGNDPYRSSTNWYNLWRGWICSLWLMYKVGDKLYLPSLADADPRDCTWQYGNKGLAQFSYPLRMDVEAAVKRFPNKNLDINTKSKYVDFECVWTELLELVYLADGTDAGVRGNPVYMKEHNLGFCPGIVTGVPGLPLTFKGQYDYSTTFSYRGESLLAANRKIYPMLDRLASLIASVAHQGWKAPAVLKHDGDADFEEEPGMSGTVTQIPKEAELQAWPFRDLNNALTYLNGLLSSNKQKGGLSEVQYGNLQFQVASLVVAQLKDEESGIFVNHRLANKIHFLQGFENFQKMISTGKFYKVDESLVNLDDAIEIDKSLFEKKFTINIEFMRISPEENITNWTIANQADKYKAEVDILRDIVHDPDPEGTWERKRLSMSENTVPGLREINMLMATAEGSLPEEKKQKLRNALIWRYVNNLIDAPGQNPALSLPGAASQPKMLPEGKGTPEQLSQRGLNQSGQMQQINARRSTGG